ncbi:MAG: outer membrane beta-barrel protein [Tunicatimonas sp.]|uniref:outer membrane beta-barrel protein n=1 Tax=Tunicatimonas sp. TaxID=1940096 RepID=UPI003C7677E8
MKQTLLIFLLVYGFNAALAQQTTWGVNIAPSISHRLPQTKTLPAREESVRSGERPMHTFDFGIDFRTAINDHWYVGTALLYSQKGFANTNVAIPYPDIRVSRAHIIDFIQNYLEIPFFVTRTVFKNNRFQLYPMVGVTNSLLLSEKNRVAVRGGEVDKEVEEALSKPYLRTKQVHNIGLLGGFGIQASVDPKTFIGLEAQTKFMLSPLADISSQSQRNLYSVGLNFRFVRTLR